LWLFEPVDFGAVQFGFLCYHNIRAVMSVRSMATTYPVLVDQHSPEPFSEFVVFVQLPREVDHRCRTTTPGVVGTAVLAQQQAPILESAIARTANRRRKTPSR